MATKQSIVIKVIEQSQVAPPPGSVSTRTTTTVPLTFFDIPWFRSPPIEWIFFYELPYTTLHFMQTVLPHLKESLSLTLSHFFPFAGKLTCPPLHYHPISLILFTAKVTPFSCRVSSSNDMQVVPTMAIQFIVFPNSGISIGIRLVRGDVPPPENNVLITIVLKRSKIEQLKHWITIQSKKDNQLASSGPVGLSTFVVTYCIERFDQHFIPGTYLGNCLKSNYVSAKRRELMGEDGITVAAIAIRRKICELGKGALVIGKTG
ncbi:hypothetical protein EZV62_020516 [Acer yangbiense]|uniref:Uncharacterized protein n=1 Tax=Acer yangbiense TaxID=1000413 RepID=A0A5C7HE16_9ROSI|nr:hypothetical protein EZV62_020516 [Acer yangbiense]